MKIFWTESFLLCRNDVFKFLHCYLDMLVRILKDFFSKNCPKHFEHFLVLRYEKSGTQIVVNSLLKAPTKNDGQ